MWMLFCSSNWHFSCSLSYSNCTCMHILLKVINLERDSVFSELRTSPNGKWTKPYIKNTHIKPLLLRIVAKDSAVRHPFSICARTDSTKNLKVNWSSLLILVIWSMKTATLSHKIALHSNKVITWNQTKINITYVISIYCAWLGW